MHSSLSQSLYVLNSKLGGGNFVLERYLYLSKCNLVTTQCTTELECFLGYDQKTTLFSFSNDARWVAYPLAVLVQSLHAVFFSRSDTVQFTHVIQLIPFVFLNILPRKKAVFLAQDYDVNFFPSLVRPIIKYLLHLFIAQGGILLCSNPWLEAYYTAKGFKCKLSALLWDSLYSYVFSYLPRDFPIDPFIVNPSPRTYDFCILLRNGSHKNANLTRIVASQLINSGFSVRLINFTDIAIPTISHTSLTVSGPLLQDKFLEALSASRGFVCLSLWEGFGIPIIQAFGLGCYVYSTPLPSTCFLDQLYPNNPLVRLIDIHSSISVAEQLSRHAKA